MENILKIASQNVDCSLNTPDDDDGIGHLFTGPHLHHHLLHLSQHLDLTDHLLCLLQLSDIRAGPAQAVQCHGGGALVSGESSEHIISPDKVFKVLTGDISDRASADRECEQAVWDQGEV